MSAVKDGIEGAKLALDLVEKLISFFGWDRTKVLHVAREELHKMAPAPPAQDEEYLAAKRALENDTDERSELTGRSRQVGALRVHVQQNDDAHDTDRVPPPRESER